MKIRKQADMKKRIFYRRYMAEKGRIFISGTNTNCSGLPNSTKLIPNSTLLLTLREIGYIMSLEGDEYDYIWNHCGGDAQMQIWME